MIPNLRRPLLAAAALLAGLALAIPARADSILQQVISRGTVRIAVLGSLPPYAKLNPSGEPEGYDIDIAKRLAEALKVKPEFIVTDIPGRVTALQTHKADLTIADFTRNVERSTTIAFTDPYIVTFLQILLKADSPLKSEAELDDAKIKVAISRGGTAEHSVPALAPKAQLVRFNTQADELNALLSGQVDAMAEDGFYDAQAMKDHPGALRVMSGKYARAEIAIGLPAGDFDWYRIINLWVEQFNASGDNAKLFKQWFGYDQPQLQVVY
jgi:polar amino acid transport system substrate-binding protein